MFSILTFSGGLFRLLFVVACPRTVQFPHCVFLLVLFNTWAPCFPLSFFSFSYFVHPRVAPSFTFVPLLKTTAAVIVTATATVTAAVVLAVAAAAAAAQAVTAAAAAAVVAAAAAAAAAVAAAAAAAAARKRTGGRRKSVEEMASQGRNLRREDENKPPNKYEYKNAIMLKKDEKRAKQHSQNTAFEATRGGPCGVNRPFANTTEITQHEFRVFRPRNLGTAQLCRVQKPCSAAPMFFVDKPRGKFSRIFFAYSEMSVVKEMTEMSYLAPRFWMTWSFSVRYCCSSEMSAVSWPQHPERLFFGRIGRVAAAASFRWAWATSSRVYGRQRSGPYNRVNQRPISAYQKQPSTLPAQQYGAGWLRKGR